MLPPGQTELPQTRAQRAAVLGDILRLKELLLVSQSCRTLCNSIDYSPPGSSVHGISQARILSHFLFQEIFPTQGLNPRLLLGRQILYHWATWEVLRWEEICGQISVRDMACKGLPEGPPTPMKVSGKLQDKVTAFSVDRAFPTAILRRISNDSNGGESHVEKDTREMLLTEPQAQDELHLSRCLGASMCMCLFLLLFLVLPPSFPSFFFFSCFLRGNTLLWSKPVSWKTGKLIFAIALTLRAVRSVPSTPEGGPIHRSSPFWLLSHSALGHFLNTI